MNAPQYHIGSTQVRIAACLAAIVALLCGPSVARAATMSYSLSMSNDYGWIQNPASDMAQMAAKNKTSAVIATQYNNPILELTNTSVSANISDVKLIVNDPDSAINALKVLQGPPGAHAVGQFANAVWGSSTKTIEIALPTPLAPNASLFFTLNLTPTAGASATWMPGFQNSLWSSSTVSPNTNANLAVTYVDPSNGNATSVSNLQLTNDPNQMFIQRLMSTCCNSNTAASTLLNASIGGPSIVTPEPASVVLMMLGSLPLGIGFWRNRRKLAAVKQAEAIA